MNNEEVGQINQELFLSELFVLLEALMEKWTSLEDVENEIQNIIDQEYNNFLISQPIDKQKNVEFQKLLYISLENVIMAFLNDHIFRLICTQFEKDDMVIYNKCLELSALKVTADQLGALEDYAIPFPAAVSQTFSS